MADTTLQTEEITPAAGEATGGNYAYREAAQAALSPEATSSTGADRDVRPEERSGPGADEPAAREGEQEEPLVPFKRVRDLQSQSDRLRHQLAQRDEEVQRLQESLQTAAMKYRQALMAAYPVIPEQLLSGSTIEELETSLDRARSAVEMVRQKLEEDMARSLSIPAGAPVRRGPDTSSLSPREKIAQGLVGK